MVLAFNQIFRAKIFKLAFKIIDLTHGMQYVFRHERALYGNRNRVLTVSYNLQLTHT